MAGKNLLPSKRNSIERIFKKHTKSVVSRLVNLIRKKPLTSFVGLLGILLLVIILANLINAPQGQKQNDAAQVKQVAFYNIGISPKVSLPAKIEKSGVIKIVAQTSGVVQAVNVTEGDSIPQGTPLVDISTTYQGGDAAAIQAQIAKDQYDNTTQTYGMQQDLIANQRDIATISAQNTDQLRQISQQSVDSTNSLISLNQGIVDSLNQNLIINPSDTQTKELVSQFQSAINQLQVGVNQTKYQTNTDNPPTLLANIQKDVVLKQLDIQQKSLDLGKEISQLQLNLANLNESLMHPATPIAGTVERINVSVGQTVTPGTVIGTITSNLDNPDVTAVVAVPNQIANTVSRIEPSILHIGSKVITATPRYISSEATDGTMYTILYSIPQENQKDLTNSGYITIDIPLGLPNTSGIVPFVPLDAMYQNQDEAYVYVNNNGTVQSKKVTIGDVFGNFAEITSGIKTGDQVIIDRNVVAGDKITTK